MKRPVLRYHGGKFLLAPWIISFFPKHRTYYEGFGGAGSVLMQKSRAHFEVYNDVWDTVVNVFQVLRDPIAAMELERVLRLTPFARTEFEKCGELDLAMVTNPIEKARLTIFRSFAGFASASTNAKYATGFRSSSRLSGNAPARDWANYPDNIKDFSERLQGVVIEKQDYREGILKYDAPDSLIYLDPTYVHETRNMQRGNAAYVHEMTDQDHIEMAGIVNQLKGMVIISGYECDLYSEIFKGWQIHRKKAFADGARERTECVWLNEAAVQSLNRNDLFTQISLLNTENK